MEPQRHRHEPELSRPDPAGPALASSKPAWPGSRQANTPKQPLSVPPFAARRRPEISAARRGAPAAAGVLAAGAGNHFDRSPPPQAFTRAPRQLPPRRGSAAASPAHHPGPVDPEPGLAGPGRCQARRAAAVPPLPRPPPGPEANQVTSRRPDERRRRPPGDLDGTAMPARPQDDTSNHPAATGSPASSGSRINENNHRG